LGEPFSGLSDRSIPKLNLDAGGPCLPSLDVARQETTKRLAECPCKHDDGNRPGQRTGEG